jgi:hypothetical protein
MDIFFNLKGLRFKKQKRDLSVKRHFVIESPVNVESIGTRGNNKLSIGTTFDPR